MKVLIIGSGGREHALAWKVAQSPRVGQVFVAPGNAGTRLEPRTTNVDIAADDVEGLLEFARRERIDLTIVGPEGPLVLGLCDEFAAAGLRCYRAEQARCAARGLEGLHQGFPAAPRHPDGRVRHVYARNVRRGVDSLRSSRHSS